MLLVKYAHWNDAKFLIKQNSILQLLNTTIF